jgi:putative DNA methylase
MARNGRRLIEDYLPIQEVSAKAAREKSVRRGHISTLHLWWARRPLVACRATIYGALVPADAFSAEVTIHNPPEDPRETAAIKEDLAKRYRRGLAGEFVKDLCKYPGDPRKIEEAQRHILTAHAAKLSAETGKTISVEDILQGRAPRPRVLDMFAGGGSIPLEALRLGCEAHALDLDPVAHLIELCTLVYPQKYGLADPAVKGSAGDGTWAGLAEEVNHWGKCVLERARAEVGDLYPAIPDPTFEGTRTSPQPGLFGEGAGACVGLLTPVAYLWARTVRCKNPMCGATVPLVRQTWLCKKKGRYVAFKMIAPPGKKQVCFEVVEAPTQTGLGFDPASFSKGGNATCPFCGAVADANYVKEEGVGKRLGQQLMGIACTARGRAGKVYLSADQAARLLASAGQDPVPTDEVVVGRSGEFCKRSGLTVPDEPINNDAKNANFCTLYSLTRFSDLFLPRQLLSLLAFVRGTLDAETAMQQTGYRPEFRTAVLTAIASVLDKQADFNSSLCTLEPDGGRGIHHTFGRAALPMVWDFAEANPFNSEIACWLSALKEVVGNLRELAGGRPAEVRRGTATHAPWPDGSFDAIVTDPPYYDNVPYANVSDFFYVWMKRTIGHLHPEHLSLESTPKKAEIVADATRHGGSKTKARQAYEAMMAEAFREASRLLKPNAPFTVVYAHKTTQGWTTLVEAIPGSRVHRDEAWPLDTETTGRLRAQSSAALASSIFLVARKRNGAGIGNYEEEVRPELEQIVRERVDTLWKMGITGADLIIAAVGAGLRAFTQHARVEFANGEEVPATTFLREVEGVVHEALLEKIFSAPRSRVAAVDSASRFYVLWRYTYGAAALGAGEAIVFTYGLDVELDNGLSSGSRALVEKKKGTYRLRDFTERGDDPKLGLPGDDARPAPLIDALHRVLWLIEHEPRGLPRFLDEAAPDGERLRVLAQALAGPALKGQGEAEAGLMATTTPKEQAALGKLLANWKSLIEARLSAGDGTLFGRKKQP